MFSSVYKSLMMFIFRIIDDWYKLEAIKATTTNHFIVSCFWEKYFSGRGGDLKL